MSVIELSGKVKAILVLEDGRGQKRHIVVTSQCCPECIESGSNQGQFGHPDCKIAYKGLPADAVVSQVGSGNIGGEEVTFFEIIRLAKPHATNR